MEEDRQSILEIESILPDLKGKGHPLLMTAFSDCVVFSVDRMDGSGLMSILEIIAQFCARSFALGYLVRGGLTVGPLFHQHSIIFGAAMIEAYELESQNANYPRILISPTVEEDIKVFDPVFPMSGVEAIRRDKDDFLYVHILGHEVGLTGQDGYFDLIRRKLLEMLSLYESEKAQEKIKWAIGYFNNTIKEIHETGATSVPLVDLEWGRPVRC